VERAEMENTFNMGVGMVAVVDAAEVDRALAVLTARHVPAWVLGEVRKSRDVTVDVDSKGSARAMLHGEHPRF
jgi:phosphoribosylformylglycinamidine cyclo-ligase